METGGYHAAKEKSRIKSHREEERREYGTLHYVVPLGSSHTAIRQILNATTEKVPSPVTVLVLEISSYNLKVKECQRTAWLTLMVNLVTISYMVYRMGHNDCRAVFSV